MKKFLSLFEACLCSASFAQFSKQYAPFPQAEINQATQLAAEGKLMSVKQSQNKMSAANSSANVMQMLKKIEEVKINAGK